ncbi:MAG: hypothetical protein J5379_03735 [Clostridiales bacterium]|nr:hypothetical protein [Clostridiales bacterium]
MSFLLFFPGLFLGMQIIGLIRVGFHYLYYRAKGYTCVAVTCLNLRWEKDFYDREKPGRMKFMVTKLNDLIPGILMLKKPARTPEEQRRSYRNHAIVYAILAVAMLAVDLYMQDTQPIPNDYLNQFVCGVAAGVFVIYLTLALGMYMYMKEPKGLKVKVLEMHAALQTKETLEAYVLPPMVQEPYSKASLSDKFNYLSLYYAIAEYKNDLNALAECANVWMRLGTTLLTGPAKFHTDSTLFSYFSFRQINPEMAKKYYLQSKKQIDEDSDCNGRRKLAYYSYFILHDSAAAAKYVEEGLSALKVDDIRRLDTTNELEERMLLYLKSLLDKET